MEHGNAGCGAGDRQRPAATGVGNGMHRPVYRVTREYGGPEEGGWWWNRAEQESYLPTDGTIEDVERCVRMMESRFTDEGDIYSVRGGTSFMVCVEPALGINEVLTSGGYE